LVAKVSAYEEEEHAQKILTPESTNELDDAPGDMQAGSDGSPFLTLFDNAVVSEFLSQNLNCHRGIVVLCDCTGLWITVQIKVLSVLQYIRCDTYYVSQVDGRVALEIRALSLSTRSELR
jgi:hypothetical protein